VLAQFACPTNLVNLTATPSQASWCNGQDSGHG
jgi:hypothetical protein